MIHYREDCKNDNAHTLTDICTECAWHHHYDFVQHYKNGTDSPDHIEQKLLTRLRTDTHCKLRVGPKRHALCGHVGVWQGSVCAVCAEIKREQSKKPVTSQREQIQTNIDQLNQNIAELTGKRDTLQNLLTLDMAGFPVGKVSSVTRPASPRQRAIQEGKKWYMPYEPCKHCGVIAERYVANGRCRSCGN